jgi:polynucleotide 5'-hydroxyl-kinase GRC3/NOL9
MISLSLLSAPLLGPSFTHFTNKPKPTKQHHIGYPTPRDDPGAYMRSVIDLLNTHRSQHPRVPLIINSFGWIKALGLELLADIAQHAQVTDVVFLGGGGAAVAEVMGQGINFHELSSAAAMATAQAGGMGGAGRFSPADLRALQSAAYFHPQDFSPLTHQKPWVVPYPSAIVGVDVLGESIDSADTRDAVEGTVVGVLLVDDVAEPIQVGKGLPLVGGVAPEGAECVGLAVVRAVDMEKQEVQLLMPVAVEDIEQWGDRQVVLQRGRGEIGLVEMLTGKEYKDGEAPWLQMGGKEKGKVWRVRRNVMRRGQQ